MEVPPDMKPGEVMRWRIAPPHEFRMEVPPDVKPGMEVRFVRPDGIEVMVPVPPNLKPGEFFEILPPALMVRVPQGCGAGDAVVFRHEVEQTRNGQQLTQWLRAIIPNGCPPGSYFAARLPRPGAPPALPQAQSQVLPRQPIPSQWSP